MKFFKYWEDLFIFVAPALNFNSNNFSTRAASLLMIKHKNILKCLAIILVILIW